MLQRAFLPILVTTSVLAGCGGGGSDDDEVTWRLPCGATSGYDGVTSFSYVYEHDADGNRTLEEVFRLSDGMMLSRYVATHEGRLLLSAELTAEQGSYRRVNEIGRNRVVRSTVTDLDPVPTDGSSVIDYTWKDGDLVTIAGDYVSPDLEDYIETFEETSTGHSLRSCSGAGACDTFLLQGPTRYVGDFARYTGYDADFGADGSVDFRYASVLDSHFLQLSSDEYRADATGTLVHMHHSETDREPDGTALRTRSGPIGGMTFILENDFECEASRVAAGAPAAALPAVRDLEHLLRRRGLAGSPHHGM